jgi:acetylornithine/N-succinyldiaminopimelate aminotransferase
MDALLPVFARDLVLVKGKGTTLIDKDGRRYVDFAAGVAVNGLGYGDRRVVNAIRKQAALLIHASNLYFSEPVMAAAERLVALAFPSQVFFTNSGAEAIECAIKTARKYHWANGQPERIDIIGFDGSFHGRTIATIFAAGNPSYVEGFGPALPGFVQAKFGDLEGLRELVGPSTAAILLEPVQGEGGARSWTEAQLKEIRQLCDETGTLLIYDEIQCGLGRTGKLFAYEWADGAADPDIMAVAKALGGGFPVGACLATAEAAKGMGPGSHGSTYGGNPLAMAVGVASVEELIKPELLAHVREVAGYLNQQLSGLKDRFPDVVLDIRGKGLLIGIKLGTPNREFMQLARDNHLLIAGGGDNCVRLLPPLTLSLDEAREAIGLLEKSCEAAQAKAKAA